MNPTRTVLICQNKTCRKQGSAEVLEAFQSEATDQAEIQPSGCMGQCGNGPMVLILPDQVWYSRVQKEEVPAVIDRHLQGGKPIAAMLYRKFHPIV